MNVKSVLKDSLKIYSGKILSFLFANLTFLMLSIYMLKDQFGIFVMVRQLFLVLISLVNIFGVPASIAFFAAKTESYDINLKRIISFIGIFSAIIMVPIFGIELLLKPFLYNNLSSFLLFLLVLMVPIYLIQQALTGFFMGKNKINFFVLTLIALPIIFFLSSIAALKFDYKNANNMTMIWLLANGLAALVSLYSYLRYSGKKIGIIEEIKIQKLTGFGLTLMPVGIMACLTARVDRFIINGFLGASSVAEYSIAMTFAELSWFISFALYGSIFKKIASANETEARKMTLKYLKYCLGALILFSIIYIPVVLFAIGRIFGSKYPNLGYLFIISYPGIALLNFNMVSDAFITGQLGKPILTFFFTIPTLLCLLILNMIAIPIWGLKGAAFVATFSYVLAVIITLIFIATKKPADKIKNKPIINYETIPEI